MKNFYATLIVLVTTFLVGTGAQAQCTNCTSQYPFGNQSIPANSPFTNITTCMYGGEYAVCNVVSGTTYTWTTCGDTDFDTQITVRQNNGTCTGAVLAYNDDACGLQSTATWTATYTGTVRVLVSAYFCASQSTCMTLQWSSSTPIAPPVGITPPVCYDMNGNTGGFNNGVGGAAWYSGATTTPSSGTGPQGADANGGSGFFFTEASGGLSNTTYAMTGYFDLSAGGYNLTFDYHMYGTNLGTLSILVNGATVWTQTGGSANAWISNSVDLSAYTSTTTEISIVATTGNGWSSDIAIDNVCINNTPPVISGCTDPASVNYNPAATIDDGSCVYPPANDDCANATSFTLTCGSSYTDAGSTANANNVGNGPTCTTPASTAGGVWYQFVGTGSDVTASLCGSSYDTKVFVYSGTCGSFTCEGGNDDACGLQSEVTIPTVQGTTYTILVAGFGSSTGDYTLTVTDNGGFSAAPTSIAGNTTICPGASTALTVTGGTLAGGASVEWFSGSCGGTAVGNGTTISVNPTSTTTYFARYTGSCNTTTCTSATVTVNPVAGPTVAGSTQLCSADNTTLVATGVQGNPLEWYSDAGGTAVINSGATFVTPNLTNNTTYYVGETAATTAGQYDQTIQVINPNLTPSNVISFPATPAGATGTPTLVITVYGDIDGTGTNLEQWQVNDESSTAIGTAGGTGNFADQCGNTITSTVNLTPAQIDGWAANGSIDFTVLDPDGNISMTLCGGDYVQLQLSYDYLSGGASACSSLLTQVDIIVDQPSTSATGVTGAGSGCLGTTSTLSVQGGSLSGSSNWEWYEGSCGGTVVGTGNSITVTPGSTTTYFVAATANGACAATTCASGTVTLPTPSAALSGNNETATCAVNQNGYIHLLTPAGDLVASINANGQNLGNVTATSYIEGTPLLLENCNNPGNASMMTSVMDRHWVITTQNAPTGPVSVLLPFTDNEVASLNIEAFNNANPDDDINFLGDVGCTKFSGANEDNLFDNNCGNGTFEWHTQTSNGQVDAYLAGHPASNKYLTIDVNGFSEFWLHGSSTNAPLPVELTRFEANCIDNGAEVSWTTASEYNASHFTVKRSLDGVDWTTIAYVDAAGNSQQMIDYSIEDNQSTDRTVYYLLE
jgi:hypothetical protein